MWKKINNWKNSFLSTEGNEILIKAVLQVVPAYTMSVFQFPKKLCTELDIMFAKFWWCNQHKNRGIIGAGGSLWESKKVWEGWVLEMWNASIKLCWLSRDGGFYITPTA